VRVAFLRHIRSLYGNEVRAWRRGLDPKGTFALSLNGLRRFCRRETKAPVDISLLWRSLDKAGTGICGLDVLCPRQAEKLASFRQWAHEEFGSCAAIWDHPATIEARRRPQRDGLWVAGKHKLLFTPLTEALRTLGCPIVGSAEARSLLLLALDYFGCGFVSRSDFEWLDSWDPPEWLYAEADPGAWEELRELLGNRYSHPLTAWRGLLDKDDSNSVSWQEFQAACREVRFSGNISGAWRKLDDDLSGYISLKEFDPPSSEILASFKDWAEQSFGSVELMFKAVDRDKSGSVSYLELKRMCRKMRWSGDVYVLFNCLDTDKRRDSGKRTLSLEELLFLDKWQATEEEEVSEPAASAVSASRAPPQRSPKLQASRSAPALPALVPLPCEAVGLASVPEDPGSPVGERLDESGAGTGPMAIKSDLQRPKWRLLDSGVMVRSYVGSPKMHFEGHKPLNPH